MRFVLCSRDPPVAQRMTLRAGMLSRRGFRNSGRCGRVRASRAGAARGGVNWDQTPPPTPLTSFEVARFWASRQMHDGDCRSRFDRKLRRRRYAAQPSVARHAGYAGSDGLVTDLPWKGYAGAAPSLPIRFLAKRSACGKVVRTLVHTSLHPANSFGRTVSTGHVALRTTFSAML